MRYNQHELTFDALSRINPNGGWTTEDRIEFSSYVGADFPDQATVDSAIAEIEAERNATQYKEDRRVLYPSIGEQLDMLYHDIKNGTLETGDWITAIEAVKAANPKP